MPQITVRSRTGHARHFTPNTLQYALDLLGVLFPNAYFLSADDRAIAAETGAILASLKTGVILVYATQAASQNDDGSQMIASIALTEPFTSRSTPC